jgi:hypothetical protein
MKTILRQALAVFAMLLGTSCQANDGSGRPQIYWQRTKAYAEQASKFKINADDALKQLVQKLQARNDRRANRLMLLVIVNDCYLFGPPEKTTTNLTGFYVDGMTGRIEHRVTDHPAIGYGKRPKAVAYQSIEVIYAP